MVAALLITTILATLALAILSQRVTQRSLVKARFLQSQARALAWAGLEDARVKLMKSPSFPPNQMAAVSTFSYSESFLDDDGTRVGTYHVEVDQRFAGEATIRSTAWLQGESAASLTLRGELDLALERPAVENLAGAVGIEERPFSWIRVEVVDGQANLE